MRESNRWRTYTHPSETTSNYGCCQIIDQRTQVIHLIGLSWLHYHCARFSPSTVDTGSLTRALWPTASTKARDALPQQLAHYLTAIRGAELPIPSQDRQMFSLTVYPDGSLSWPAITLMTREMTTSSSVL